MEVPVIKARMERIVHPDGRVDIIAHIPKLEMQQAIETYKQKQKLKEGKGD